MGNSFVLMGFDEASREVEQQRRLAEERLESERRVARELEIARQVQSQLSRKPCQRFKRWNTRVLVFRRGTWAETITITWISAGVAWARGLAA